MNKLLTNILIKVFNIYNSLIVFIKFNYIINSRQKRKRDLFMKQKKFTSTTLAAIGVMAAVIFLTTKFLRIPIPIAIGGKTRLHLGNSMCVLAGLLFGAVPGGLAAGIGTSLVDLMDPRWAPEFWITFINKFAMAYVAGKIAHIGKKSLPKDIIAATVGSFTYVALYIFKSYVQLALLGSATEANFGILATKFATSSVNAVLAIVISVVLYRIMEPILRKSNLFK